MATIANDTFTEASDTPLSSHTSDSGHSWTTQGDFDYGNYRNAATVNATRDTLTDSSGDVGFAYIDVDPGTADYAAEIDYIANSTVNFIQALLLARAQPDGEVGSSGSHAAYAAEIDINSDVVVLWVNSGSGFTQLASQPFSVVAGNTYRLRLECSGTTIKAIADPGGASETIAQATDGSITDRGRAGVAMRGLNSADLEFDNFLVEDLGGGSAVSVDIGAGNLSLTPSAFTASAGQSADIGAAALSLNGSQINFLEPPANIVRKSRSTRRRRRIRA